MRIETLPQGQLLLVATEYEKTLLAELYEKHQDFGTVLIDGKYRVNHPYITGFGVSLIGHRPAELRVIPLRNEETLQANWERPGPWVCPGRPEFEALMRDGYLVLKTTKK